MEKTQRIMVNIFILIQELYNFIPDKRYYMTFPGFKSSNPSFKRRNYLLSVVFLLCTNFAFAQEIFWTDYGSKRIQKIELNSATTIENLITSGLDNPIGLIISDDKMYWANSGPTQKIQRANLDGSNIEDLVTGGLSSIFDIAISEGKIYWTDFGSQKAIKRANLDGSGVEKILSLLPGPTGIAVSTEKIYWLDASLKKVQCANLDGSNIEDIVTTGLGNPTDIAIWAGKLYWTDRMLNKIVEANIDGSDVKDLIVNISNPSFLAFSGNRIFWTTENYGIIQSASLDGSNIQTEVHSLIAPFGIAALDSPSSTKPVYQSAKMGIFYPNPGPGIFRWREIFTENPDVYIMDIKGRTFKTAKVLNQLLDISDMPDGVYIVSMKVGNQLVQELLLKGSK